MINDYQLRAFGDAVRAKDDWVTKILDKERNLGVQWAIEAQLIAADAVSTGREPSDDEKRVLEYLLELEAEAQRIIFHDHTPHLTPHLTQTRPNYDFEKSMEEAVKSYKFLKASEYGIRPVELKEDVGVFTCDDIVPASIHSALVTELDRLAATEPKDFHPGTGGKVQDLIHPFVYPYKLNSTPLSFGTSKHVQLESTQFTSYVITGMHNSSEPLRYATPYAWIPSIFRVSPDGTSAEIQSYINGLGPRERYPDLYRIIEQVFIVVLPLLETAAQSEYMYEETASDRRWMERHDLREDPEDPHILRSKWKECVEHQARAKEKEQALRASEKHYIEMQAAIERTKFEEFGCLDLSDGRLTSSLAGRDLKIVVKAVNYVLEPGESYEDGWYIAGMPHDRIVASAIYYYESDPSMIDKGLSLRRVRDEYVEFPQIEEYSHRDFIYKLFDDLDEEGEGDGYEYDYPSDWEDNTNTSNLPQTANLGTFPTMNTDGSPGPIPGTGRIVTFPNWVQHKVAGLENIASAGGAAQRKTLWFFLVDDTLRPYMYSENHFIEQHGIVCQLQSHTVLTTADVPYQARGCNFPTLYAILSDICLLLTKKRLPAEIFILIITIDDDPCCSEQGRSFGMSRKEAEATRREAANLLSKEGQWDTLPTYSLCEH